ncbi:DUF2922 domain-containing protein [Psychrobacillus glaciei]|uniref:DUF2922 domain-containing protein n=1 Tax=Psychrobacillus glaciei TaxID=2283160 RepID=A0A5J6SN37_9BACI|nr:DUF2922 domain-containing protein [Psychrobacillus glaciei]QFF99102.1 DUF2922 domain-containing protein [Psychrobacillus glaciei]
MAKSLQLQFETTTGKRLMVTVDDPKDSLTNTEIEVGMEAIIASNVFHVEGIPLSIVKSARVVERNVTQII